MATCRNIVNRALRKIGILGAGREARPSDMNDALDALRSLYHAWIASGSFGRLADVVPTGDYVAGENQRVFRNSEGTNTITLPELVPSYASPLPYNLERDTYINYEAVDGYNRPPRDGAVVVIVNAFDGVVQSYIYDGSIKQWQEIGGLSLDDAAPRSHGDAEGLAACLSIEVADMFDREIKPSTIRAAQRFEQAMTSRFSMPREASLGMYV